MAVCRGRRFPAIATIKHGENTFFWVFRGDGDSGPVLFTFNSRDQYSWVFAGDGDKGEVLYTIRRGEGYSWIFKGDGDETPAIYTVQHGANSYGLNYSQWAGLITVLRSK